MVVQSVELRDFRSYESARVDLAQGITVFQGPNGAGKTNLLEGVYCGCTGRGLRSGRDRELIRFGAQHAHLAAVLEDDGARHRLTVAIGRSEGKVVQVDGRRVERLASGAERPLMSVFVSERLALIKGAPARRRSHLDQLVAALWPARAGERRAYLDVLRQRNALLVRIRSGRAGRASLHAWDEELARRACALADGRRSAVALLEGPLAERARELGLAGELAIEYRQRSRAVDPAAYVAELVERHDRDVEAGFCTQGPHRDDLALRQDGRELRLYGSQGQQRLTLLALLLTERRLLAERRGAPPFMLLDDVMSELDGRRRELLVRDLESDGQSIITTAEAAQVPPTRAAMSRLEIPVDVVERLVGGRAA